MRYRWARWLVIPVVATGSAGCGCGPAEAEEGCGTAARPGEYRYCSVAGTQVCVCATHRCAMTDTEDCPGSGLRYVYGGGECVPAAFASSQINSDWTDDECPTGDADADVPEGEEDGGEPDDGPDADVPGDDLGAGDADADDGRDRPDDADVPDEGTEDDADVPDEGTEDDADAPDEGEEDDAPDVPDEGMADDAPDVPDEVEEDDALDVIADAPADEAEEEATEVEADVEPEAGEEYEEDVADVGPDDAGEEDAGPPPPELGEPLRLGQGMELRYAPFAGRVLAEWVPDRTDPESGVHDVLQIHTVDWDAAGPATLVREWDVSGSGTTNVGLSSAKAYASCYDSATASRAIFWHHTFESGGDGRPWIVGVRYTAAGGTVAEDVTSQVFGGAIPADPIRAWRLVGDGRRCFAVWTIDVNPDLAAETLQVWARAIPEPGLADEWGPTQVLAEGTGWDFEAERFSIGDPVHLFASPDGTNGVAVFVPARSTGMGPALLGQRVGPTGTMWDTAAAGGKVVFVRSTPGELAALENPYGNAIRPIGSPASSFSLAVVGIDSATPTPERRLYHHLVMAASGGGMATPTDIRRSAYLRVPTLAVAAGPKVLITRWDWSGGSFAPADGLLLRGDQPALPDLALGTPGQVGFPHVGIDAGGRALVNWMGGSLLTMEFQVYVALVDSDLHVVPGWDAAGLNVMPAGAYMGGDQPDAPPPLAPADGGAFVGWTQIDAPGSPAEQSVWVRRVYAPL